LRWVEIPRRQLQWTFAANTLKINNEGVFKPRRGGRRVNGQK